jgi:hypothetical protein
MKLVLCAGLIAGLTCSAPALAAPTVRVRVEGANATLLERTSVDLGPAAVNGCPGNSASAAIEAATHGNWDRQAFTQTILGETHDFSNSDYWAEWLSRGAGYKVGNGICGDLLGEGDEVLMIADRSGPPPDYPPSVIPLDLEGAPATALTGTSVTVTVVEYRAATLSEGAGTRTPVAGATVSGGTAPVTTDADGKATVTLPGPGTATLKATKAPDAPSAGEIVAVTAAGAAPQVVAGPDRTAPAARLTGLKDHAVLSRGPRQLSGTFSDAAVVKLRLTKRLGKRCWYFSGRSERFVGTHCGKGAYFAIGDRAAWSYLLPARLGPGRYVLDAIAIDAAGNRTPLARGTTRVVFTVR